MFEITKTICCKSQNSKWSLLCGETFLCVKALNAIFGLVKQIGPAQNVLELEKMDVQNI